MLKLATETFDFYDNPEYLKEVYKTKEAIPECIKTAEFCNKDHEFAVSDGGFKRYPMNDLGNYCLSLIYFDKYAYKLPEDLRKEAMENLYENLTRYKGDIPPELKDLTTGLRSQGVEIRTRYRDWTPQPNLDKVLFPSGYSDAGEPIKDVKKVEEFKLKEGPFDKEKDKEEKGKVTEKVASFSHLALGKYPINSYSQIKQACDYFSEYYKEFSPQERVLFSRDLEKRASDIGAETTDLIKKYASNYLSSDYKYNTQLRKDFLLPEDQYLVDELVKNAESVSPFQFASALEVLDREYNLDQYWDNLLPDPYYSTLEKRAEKEDEWRYSYRDVHITKDHLKKLTNRYYPLKEMFGPEVADEIIRDPIKAFNGLNNERKYILARYASGEYIQ